LNTFFDLLASVLSLFITFSYLRLVLLLFMAAPPEHLQALIDEIDTLNCDDPSTLETIPLAAPHHKLFRIVGKLLSSQSPSAYWLRESLSHSWTFPHPFEIADLPDSKYLIQVSTQAHVDKIMELSP
jgi:hypothetical protein